MEVIIKKKIGFLENLMNFGILEKSFLEDLKEKFGSQEC
jgi:hypothetical protein